jgi:hypothetical protein
MVLQGGVEAIKQLSDMMKMIDRCGDGYTRAGVRDSCATAVSQPGITASEHGSSAPAPVRRSAGPPCLKISGFLTKIP